MTLLELIDTFDDVSNPPDILSRITTKSIQVGGVTGGQSIAAIELAYGEVFAVTLLLTFRGIIDKLKAAGDIATATYLDVYYQRLTVGSGLDFSNQMVRDKLDSLVPQVGQEGIDKLKSLGLQQVSIYEYRTGSDKLPELSDVETAVKLILAKRVVADWFARANSTIQLMVADGKSIDDIKAAIVEVN